MGVLSGRPLSDALFINMDGIRSGGPAGGGAHRLMEQQEPDKLTPFRQYYDSWFQEIRQGISYNQQRVCFKEIYFQPFPGLVWIWNDWSNINACSMKMYVRESDKRMVPVPSPLFQSFNYYLRSHWESKFKYTLPLPPAVGESHRDGVNYDKIPSTSVLKDQSIHIVIIDRGLTHKQGGNIRVIRNMAELVHAIQCIGKMCVYCIYMFMYIYVCVYVCVYRYGGCTGLHLPTCALSQPQHQDNSAGN